MLLPSHPPLTIDLGAQVGRRHDGLPAGQLPQVPSGQSLRPRRRPASLTGLGQDASAVHYPKSAASEVHERGADAVAVAVGVRLPEHDGRAEIVVLVSVS
ncbi:hypothetical protein Scani_18440 [Streptomyces caniferus]|uniref:Uncharacterized protein n=1 Tax=Streptomyces caniferus TaxID=285557 RepID=A0A640S5E8_9ACTN|nr:hypothetical protein Scani_18440 [Streptomyces caniferus]